ncbi:high affinity cAMP-specific and IBMX-insensitive 3',5'-cyclic phosphodiesterase 8B-like [Tachypleus tridentatus]|uniref:high affinity cAMP-specific and IBMX-insensitive 3',5'-cyclic phosphodiesterase 8B-like n=1 Tax=Tachypleus tridentatus TaxID=6853 RepID=UPI003FD11D4A
MASSGLLQRNSILGPFPKSLEKSPEEKTKVTVGRRDDGTLCIEVTENTEVESEGKHLNISKSEHALIQKLNLCDRRSHPIGQFKTLQRPKRNQPILKPEIHRQPGIDDSCSGITQCILDSAKQWAFNTFTLDVVTGGRPLSVLLVHLFQQYGLIKDFQLDVLKVYKCFSLIEVGYHTDNPYHNAVHAADVTQAMHCFLQEDMVGTDQVIGVSSIIDS